MAVRYYGKEMHEAATNYLQKLKKAGAAVEDAERARKALPSISGPSISHETNLAIAKADIKLSEARKEYETVKKEAAGVTDQLKSVVQDVRVAADRKYMADPAKIDQNMLLLLQSGILTSGEYEALLTETRDNNPTMARLVAKYAGDAAEARINDAMTGRDEEAVMLRAVADEGRQIGGRKYVENAETIAGIFSTCVRNPLIIDQFDDMISGCPEIIDSL